MRIPGPRLPPGAWRVAARAATVALLLSATAAAAAADSASPAPSPGPCQRYSEWLCTEAADTVVACVAMRHLVEILPPAACEAALADRQHATATLDAWRARCDQLISRLCADIGPTTETCRRIVDQRAYFTPDRCEDMWKDYDSLIVQFRGEEARLHPLPPDVRARIAAGDAPSFGPPDAPVTLVQFSDFECPFCIQARLTAGAIFEQYGTRVRFVFRQLPLDIHPRAELAARASLEAHAQGKFWPFHDALYAHTEARDRDGLIRLATSVGLDVPRFTAALDSNAHADALAADEQLAALANVIGTPTLFLDGRRLDRPGDYPTVLAEVERALQAAGAAAPPRAAGSPPVSGVPEGARN